MTVVAGFQHNDVPILFGDFLLTIGGTPSGTRRKLFRFSPNFVAGWTGARLTARTIMGELFNKFSGTNPTMEEVKAFLINLPICHSEGMEVCITGWVIDDSAHCFYWWSNHPSEVFESENCFLGSGG